MIRGTGIDSTVKLYLKGNGANGSKKIFDDSHSHQSGTAYGNTAVSTANPRYWTGAYTFAATGDVITIPFNSAFDMNRGIKSIGFWFRPDKNLNSSSTQHMIINMWCDPSLYWMLDYYAGSFRYSQRQTSPTATVSVSYVIDFAANTWYYITIVKNNTLVDLYINGSNVVSGTFNNTYPTPTNLPLYIGNARTDLKYPCGGQITDIIVTDGQLIDGTIIPTRQRG